MLVVGLMIYQDLVFRPFLIKHHCLKKPQQAAGEEDSGESQTALTCDERLQICQTILIHVYIVTPVDNIFLP